MTIKVNTLESGTHTFPSADKLKVDADGRLWVGRGELTEAIFNIKEWLAVVSEVDAEKITEPRVWQSLVDVPAGVTVKDHEGFHWETNEGTSRMGDKDGTWWGDFRPLVKSEDDYAPFTEVLDK